FHHLVQRGALALLFLGMDVAGRHRHASLHRQPLDRFREGEAFELGQEGEVVTRFAAAEAVVAALAIFGMKGGRLFAVERTAGPEIALLSLRLAPIPRHTSADDRGDRQPGADFVEKGGREAHWTPK